MPSLFSHRLLFHEGGVAVLDKPAGLPTTGRTLDDPDCLQYEAITHFRRRVWAVHQLDAETSGVVVMVLRKSLVPIWQRRLTADSTVKRYHAIIHGALPSAETVVNAPLGPDRKRPGFQAVRADGKSARTDFRTLATSGAHSLVEATLHTGRTHQIRVHLEHLGTRLLGEKRYGPHAPCTLHPRHALHAAEIVFRDGEHPDHLRAPRPDDLAALLLQLGLDG